MPTSPKTSTKAVAPRTWAKNGPLTKSQYTALRRDVEKLLSEAESSASLGKLQA
jgi:hypothetical protein